jgi:hypothetical protein
LLLDGLAEANGGVDTSTLIIGVTGGSALSAHTHSVGLALVLGTELFRPSVGDALEGAAVLVFGALSVFAAAGEAAVVGTWAAGTGHALLRLGTRRVETCQQALAIDADARITALEVELAAKGWWVG